MGPFWKSKTGKLIIGGCGSQVGMLLTLSGLASIFLFCAICAVFNVLSIGLTQEMAKVPPGEAIGASPPLEEVELLRKQVDFLRVRVKSLRTNVSLVSSPAAIPLPPPPKPMVTASHSAVNLRSGPGLNYNRVGRLPLGESLEIVGRNSDTTWWLVSAPGGFAWLYTGVVVATHVDDSIPVVTIPALLVQPAAGGPSVAVSSTVPPTTPVAPTPVLPPGTPTATANQSRRFVQDTLGYKQLIRRLLLPTVSESFSPHGDQIAVTEKIKLYAITTDGSRRRILLEDDESINLIGGAVWSADGEYIAFVADRRDDCDHCRAVGLVRTSDGSISFLDPPSGSGLDKPRWTQDGRLLVNVYWDEPVHGTAYIYDTSGQGQPASGSYVLSSSHDGQKWFPWQPGKTWQVDNSERTDSYYSD